MKYAVRKYVGAIGILWGYLFALSVSAQNVPPLTNPLGPNTTFGTVLTNINSFLLVIAAPICGIMVVWGGFQMMTAAGNPEKFSEGRKTLTYAAIGFVVVIFAGSVSYVIKNIMSGS